jgi:DNA-binding transcriptional LysR family regulator
MVRHLPPLAALRAFEAAARHLNFTRAAEELHLTHGAISHQMKALEASLGAPLFRREGRKLLLTDAGQRFASRLRDLLGDLGAAVAEVTQRRDQQGGSRAFTRRIPRSTSISARPRRLPSSAPRASISRSGSAAEAGRGW